jgi:glyoxylase-like metal-dependent hydrolase (beta-lactamase superfamily II)
MISRRMFLATGGAALAGRSVAWDPTVLPPQAADSTYFAWQQLAEGVRLALGAGGTSMVIGSEGEALLVDCKGYGLGATLRREVEADGSRLVAVVNTHHHSAQTGGNYAFSPDVPLIAHRRAGPRIVSGVESVLEAIEQDPEGGIIARRRQQIFEAAHSDAGARQALEDFDAHVAGVDRLVPGSFRPTIAFEGSHALRVGSIDVELRHFGRAHTDDDIVVWIPALNLMHVGNLLYIDTHPIIDALRGGDTRGWQRCLQRAHELAGPEALVVPSDGGLIASTHDFDTQIDYFEQIRALAGNALDASMSRQEMVDFIPSTGMGRFTRLASPERLPDNLGIVYDELSRER